MQTGKCVARMQNFAHPGQILGGCLPESLAVSDSRHSRYSKVGGHVGSNMVSFRI